MTTDTVTTPNRSSCEIVDASQAGAPPATCTARPSKLIGKALNEHEIVTLQEIAARHHHADFRRRALGLLALHWGHKVAHICQLLQVSDQPLYNWPKPGERGAGGHLGRPPRRRTAQAQRRTAR